MIGGLSRLASAVAVVRPADIASPARGVWYVGPLPLRAYAIFIIIGIIVATLWGNRRFVARGGRPGRVTDVAVYCVPFGLVGGRLYHVITDNELYFRSGKNPWNAFAIWDGGLGIWGAVALGGLGAWLGCRRYKVPLSAFADSVAPGLIVAQAIGRLGNYFNQELYGSATTLPWGLNVFLRTPGGVAGTQADCGPVNSAPEFPTSYIKASPQILCGTYQPTFLYELLWNLAVAGLLVWADRRFTLGSGRVFWLYVAGYTLGRGWIEMLRIDTANHFLGLRINVFTAIIMFVVAIVFLIALRNKPREDPAVVFGGDAVDHGGAISSPAGVQSADDTHPSDSDAVAAGRTGISGTGTAGTAATSGDAVVTGSSPADELRQPDEPVVAGEAASVVHLAKGADVPGNRD